jgi:DNA mismatch repair ATPase MutL
MLRDVLEREAADWIVAGARERLAASLACHSAVRAGQALSRESMAAIVQDLGRTTHPNLCPHGRATTVRIPATRSAAGLDARVEKAVTARGGPASGRGWSTSWAGCCRSPA